MAWTTPKTWNTGDLVTATDLNTHLRDNLDALKGPPTDSYVLNESADYTTTSTTFVDVDSTNLNLTITTTGGDVLVVFTGSVTPQATTNAYFDLLLDGTRVGGNDGIICIFTTTTPIGLCYLLTGVSTGAHVIKLQWKVNAGTTTLHAGAGTSMLDLHPQFWAREVS